MQVLQLCFLQLPTAADANDFHDFWHDKIVFIDTFLLYLGYNDDDRALHDLSADSTLTSPLPLADWSCYICDLSLPVVQS